MSGRFNQSSSRSSQVIAARFQKGYSDEPEGDCDPEEHDQSDADHLEDLNVFVELRDGRPPPPDRCDEPQNKKRDRQDRGGGVSNLGSHLDTPPVGCG